MAEFWPRIERRPGQPERVRVVVKNLYADDASGNRSKMWNAYRIVCIQVCTSTVSLGVIFLQQIE